MLHSLFEFVVHFERSADGRRRVELPRDPTVPLVEPAALVGDRSLRFAQVLSNLKGPVVPDAQRGVDEPIAAGRVVAVVRKVVEHLPPDECPVCANREVDGVPVFCLALVRPWNRNDRRDRWNLGDALYDLAARRNLVPGVPARRVPARAARQLVGTRPSDEQIVSAPTGEDVVPRGSVELVASAAAREDVVSGGTVELVVAAPAD